MSAPVRPRNLRYATLKLAVDVPSLRPYLVPLFARSFQAKEFPSEEALKKYLEEHPGADRSHHSVRETEKPKAKPEPEDNGKPPEKPKGEKRKKPPMRPSGWSEKDDAGNTYWGESSEISGDAVVKDSEVAGRISEDAKVTKSSISVGAQISGNADISGSEIKGLVGIKGNAKLDDAKIDAHNITIEGDTQITNALITGGNWDGQKVKGGRWSDSYDQETIDILEKYNDPKYPFRMGTGDGPIRAMAMWLEDGGKLKGILGGKKSRKKLQKAIADHIDYGYPKNDHARSGVDRLEDISDDDFEALIEAAQEKVKLKKLKSGKIAAMDDSALRSRLIRLASANPEIRPYVLPMLREDSQQQDVMWFRRIKAAASALDKAKKRGEWNLVLYKSRPTRWEYFLENPQGGGGGSTSYPSQKAAINAATARVNWQGKKRYQLIIAKWDPQLEDYKVTKTEWRKVPDQGKKAGDLAERILQVAADHPEHEDKLRPLVKLAVLEDA